MTMDSVVSTVTRLWAESPINHGLFTCMGKRLFIHFINNSFQ